MKIQNRLAEIAEGLYFLNRQFDKDLVTTLKSKQSKGDGL